MIVRALFWIVIVMLFVPRGPNLGLDQQNPGQKDTGMISLPASLSALASVPQKACTDNAKDCATVLGVVDNLQDVALRGLARVKAEIAKSQRERATRDANNS